MLIETRKTARSAGRFAAVALVACASTACGAADVRVGEAIVRDSAGITIVENDGPVWRSGQEWTVDTEAYLVIGMTEGPAEYMFDRVVGAARLTDGRLVVANSGSAELRFFDAAGRHLTNAGRSGEGPGEFRFLGRLFATAGDTLLAHDFMTRRVSVFDAEGGFVRSGRGDAANTIEGALDARSVLATGGRVFDPQQPRFGQPLRDDVPLLRIELEAGSADTLAVVTGPQRLLIGDMNRFVVSAPPFGRSTVFAVGPARYYMGTQDAFEIGEYAADGRLLRLLRRNVEPAVVSQEDIAAYRGRAAQAIDANPQMSSAMADAMRRVSFPATHPAHGELYLDAEQNLWVREVESGPSSGFPNWSVFDRDGRFLGSVTTPLGLRIYQIGSGYVLGVARDGLGVEYVHLHLLHKPISP
jgi:hypothetical protein